MPQTPVSRVGSCGALSSSPSSASGMLGATLPLSTLVPSPLATPLRSTHVHLFHSRPPITRAVPTHANLVFLNSFPCNTCEKMSCGRRADIVECGGSPPLSPFTGCRLINRLGGMDGIAKAGANSRTPKNGPRAARPRRPPLQQQEKPKSASRNACTTRADLLSCRLSAVDCRL
jgi:hypothetical protein